MKMIIVDDEVGIANSIKNIFDWSDIGIEEVYVFDSSVDALNHINDDTIDILMTDIRMPEMDGLELSRQAIEKTPGIKVIMFSGYDDFEYTKEAMRIGVTDYLLKPVTLEDVTEAVKRTVDLIQQERLQKQLRIEHEKRIDAYIKNAKDMFAAKLIQKNTILKDEEIKKYFELAEIADTPKTGCAICVKAIGQKHNGLWNLKEDSSLICFALNNMLNEILHGEGHSFYDGSKGTVILVFGKDDVSEYTETTKLCIKSIRDTIGIEVAVGVGTVTDSVTNMYDSYCHAYNACMHNAFYKISGICNMNQINNIYKYPQELESKLSESLSVSDSKKESSVENILDEYFVGISCGDIPVQNIRTICNNILIGCMKRLQLINSEYENFIISEWLEKESEIENIDDLKENLKISLKKIEEYLKTSVKDKNIRLIENVKMYIEENIDKGLSLETVSKRFFFSSRYFARLFKDYIGKSYSDYVNDIKMETAKKYLSNSDISIGEIARKIGYEDQGHFGRNFKKYTGKKPSEYRKGK